MKSLKRIPKRIPLLCFGLTLVLCLVSFSGDAPQSLPETFKTELIVNETTPSARFSIQFNKVDNIVFISFFSYSNTSFNIFKIAQNLKDNTAFKAYTKKTRSIITEQLQHKLYASLNHQILYENSIV